MITMVMVVNIIIIIKSSSLTEIVSFITSSLIYWGCFPVAGHGHRKRDVSEEEVEAARSLLYSTKSANCQRICENQLQVGEKDNKAEYSA